MQLRRAVAAVLFVHTVQAAQHPHPDVRACPPCPALPCPAGVVSHWPAYTNWTDDYLCQLAGDTEVTVALTPNGRADAVTPLPGSGGAGLSGAGSATTSPDGGSSPTAAAAAAPVAAANGDAGGSAGDESGKCFALPHQVKLPLKDFLTLLRTSRESPPGAATGEANGRPGGCGVVPYLQVHAGGGGGGGGLKQRLLVRGDVSVPGAAMRHLQSSTGMCCHGLLPCLPSPGPSSIPPSGSSPPPASSSCLPTLQYQNSSLTAEVPQLLGDVDLLLSWATQAFGEGAFGGSAWPVPPLA